MNLEDLTIAQARQIVDMFKGISLVSATTSFQPYELGKAYILRTVTHTDVGIVKEVGEHEIVLQDAAWVADSGRWADALSTGELSEVEPYPEGLVIIGRGAVVDAARWNHPVPRKQK